ncbi:hypothetical protein ES703_00774 [subsurface metagenome]
MQRKEIEAARKYATLLKWGGVFTIALGAVILIGSTLLLGMAMGRVEAPFLEYVIPTEFAKAIAGVGILFGLIFVLEGAVTIYYVLKIEKVLT